MKHQMCLLMGIVAASVGAMPTLSNVSVVQSGNRTVIVSYELSGEPAVVTIDIQTNAVANAVDGWASIGGENVTPSLFGDVSKVIGCDDGAHVISWKPTESWPDHRFVDGTARAVLTAWPTNAPPTYMTVCLTNRTGASYAWYASGDYVPGGITNRIYKTTSLVFRKIPAAGIIWQMGSPTSEGYRSSNEDLHNVTLTDDYYMCCYETTAKQYEIVYSDGFCTVNNANPSTWTADPTVFSAEDLEEMPVGTVGYYHLRGVHGNLEWSWPQAGHAVRPKGSNKYSGAWLASLRYVTGDKVDFDLPTEAQWEYACRCGTATSTYLGDVSGDILNRIAWWHGNSAVNGKRQPHPVGRMDPNEWDLYDMLGNQMEWCLDNYTAQLGTNGVVDPEGPETPDGPNQRVLKGGEFSGYYGTHNSGSYRAAGRQRIDTYYQQPFLGFRLWAPAIAVKE